MTLRRLLGGGWRMALLGAVLLSAAAMSGCRGPERAPHQPIPGVDTPEHDVDNPHDQTEARAASAGSPAEPAAPPPSGSAQGHGAAASSESALLEGFISRVAEAAIVNPGPVAVFPALSRHPASGSMQVTGLGDYLARETALGLERRGVETFWSARLEAELVAANRGLDSLRALSDVFGLAEKVGAHYVVFGTADVRAPNRIERDQYLDLAWECLSLGDRRSVARISKRLESGPVVEELYRYHSVAGEWAIGAAASGVVDSRGVAGARRGSAVASLGREIAILCKEMVQELADTQPDRLRGRRIRVEPTLIPGLEGPRAELQAFSASFHRQLDLTIQRAVEDGKPNPELAAMDYGPVILEGQSYATFHQALDAFEGRLAQVKSSQSWILGVDLSRVLAEQLREVFGDEVTLLASDAERADLLDVIRSESRAVAEDQSVDPFSVARLKMKGTEVLVQSTLRPEIDQYRMRVSVQDLSTGETASLSRLVNSRFQESLDAVAGR